MPVVARDTRAIRVPRCSSGWCRVLVVDPAKGGISADNLRSASQGIAMTTLRSTIAASARQVSVEVRHQGGR